MKFPGERKFFHAGTRKGRSRFAAALPVFGLKFPVLPGLVQVQQTPGKGHQGLGAVVADELVLQIPQAHPVQVVRVLQQAGQLQGAGVVLRLEGVKDRLHVPVGPGVGGDRRFQLDQVLPGAAGKPLQL